MCFPSRSLATFLALSLALITGCSDSKSAVTPDAVALTVRTLSGNVRDTDGEPLAGARVQSDAGPATLTGAVGEFLLADLPTETLLEISAGDGAEFAPAQIVVQLPNRGDNLLDRPITLSRISSGQSASVTVEVAEGELGAELVLGDLDNPPGLRGPIGTRVSLDGQAFTGELTLCLAPAQGDDLPAALPTGRVAASVIDLHPRGTEFDPPLDLRLANDLGLPLGTAVSVFQLDTASNLWVEIADSTVTTGPTGALQIDAPVAVSRGGWYAALAEETSDCTTTVTGRIVDEADGAGVANVLVSLSTGDVVRTNAQGRFSIAAVAAHDAASFAFDGTCTAAPIGFELLTPILTGSILIKGELDATEVELGGTTQLLGSAPLAIELVPQGAVAGRILVDEDISLNPDAPVVLRSLNEAAIEREAFIGPVGDFQYTQLDPGGYRLSYLFAGDAEPSEMILEVGPNFITFVTLVRSAEALGEFAPLELQYAQNPAIYTAGVPIQDNFPSVLGNVDEFQIEPTLPSGLQFDPLTGVIFGTPASPLETAVFSVTARNEVGSTSVDLSLTIEVPPPVGLAYTTNPATYVRGFAIEPNVPAVDGFVDTFSVSPDLPAGLEIDSTSGVISGTPTQLAAASAFVVTAANSAGSASTELTLRVDPEAPSELSYSTNPATYFVGEAIQPNSATVAGIVDLFSIEPQLPPGLVFDSATGQISGTPSTPVAEQLYRVTASNVTGSAEVDLSIFVSVPAPISLDYTDNPATYTLGIGIAPNDPILVGSADSFEVAPSLPAGLTLDSQSGVISGTPLQLSSLANYTVTASNNAGSTSVQVAIRVLPVPPSQLSYSDNPVAYTQGSLIPPNQPSLSGSADLFSVVPALPAGLAIAPQSGVISGTPLQVSAFTNYTVTASNDGGSTSVTLSIRVLPTPPSNLSYSDNPAIYVQGNSIAPNTPSVQGTVDTFTINPAPPSGLSFNGTTGVLTGTPNAVSSTSGYTVTAFNDGGSTSAQLTLTVNPAAPSNLTYSDNPAQYSQGVAITANVPTVTGSVDAYSINPGLPSGLVLNTSTGVITGTPNVFGPAIQYKVRASNVTGDAEVLLTIGIDPAPPTNLAYSDNPAFYADGEPIPANTPTFTGVVDLFTVTPKLPAGLSLNSTSGVITGTPDGAVFGSVHTISASNDGGSTSVNLSLSVFGEGELYPSGQDFAVKEAPRSVVVVDLNQDGISDLVVADSVSDTVSVLLGKGAASFVAATQFDVGDGPNAVVSGDWNQDGKPDVATANNASDDITILLGSGNGGFTSTQSFPAGDGPISLANADLNNDGKPDLAVANQFSDDVTILAGQGDGTFTLYSTLGAGSGPRWVEAPDLNSDGRADLTIANSSSNDVTAWAQVGGGFTPLPSVAVGSGPISLVTPDFDGDGVLDLAVANSFSNDISVFLGIGNGAFFMGQAWPTGGSVIEEVRSADVNQDGILDLLATNGFSDDISVLLGKGDGTFEPPTQNPGIDAPEGLALADLDDDGLVDLIFTNRNSAQVSVRMGQGDGTFPGPLSFSTLGQGANDAIIADFDQNGLLDVAVANSGSVAVLLGRGDGTFNDPLIHPVGPGPNSLAAGFFDEDYALDLVVANEGSQDIFVLLGHANGTFTTGQMLVAGGPPNDIATGDFNSDGAIDFVVTSDVLDQDGVTVALGNFSGSFLALGQMQADGATAVATADLNDDKLLDLAVTGPLGVTVFLNGANGFGPSQTFPAGGLPRAVAIGDMNLDAQPDLVVANAASDNISILLGVGNGVFLAAQNFAVGDDPHDVDIADVDEDGQPDVIVANHASSELSILIGRGNGTVEPAIHSPVGDRPNAILHADFDIDGSPDIALANFAAAASFLTVLLHL